VGGGRGYGRVLAALSDDVVWTIPGSSALAGVYEDLQAYRDRVYARLDERLETWPVPQVDQLVADGEWAVVRWTGSGGKGARTTRCSTRGGCASAAIGSVR
jgi:uncharacterized protein